MSRNTIVKMLDDQYTTTKVDMQNMQYEKIGLIKDLVQMLQMHGPQTIRAI